MRVRLLAIAGGLLLSACTGPPPPNPSVTYSVHSYGCCAENTGNSTWHAGQHLALHWQPQTPGTTTDPSARQIVLSLSLTGPFATVEALKQAISQGSKPPGIRTLNSPSVSVTDRTVETPASQLDLPADLPPGYYNLDSQAAEGGNSWGGSAVVVVVR
jgi:hypothetical protein